VDEQSGYVVGMIVGNTRKDSMGTSDEIIRYFIPLVQALSASYLSDALPCAAEAS
jgi:hypothetical protein